MNIPTLLFCTEDRWGVKSNIDGVGRSIEERRMRTEMQQRESDVRSPGIVQVVKFCEIAMELFLHEEKIGKLNFKLLSICHT